MRLPAGGIKGNLTHKVGPLPVWGWGAVVAGAYVGYQWYRSRQGASSDSATSDQGAAASGADAMNGAGANYYQYPLQTQPTNGDVQRKVVQNPGHRPYYWYLYNGSWVRGGLVNPKGRAKAHR